MIPRLTAVITLVLLGTTSCDSGPTDPFGDVDFSLAFVSRRDGNDDVFVMSRDGTVTNVTDHAAEDRDPAWAPDGNRLAFTRAIGGERDVFVLDLTDGSLVNVSNHPADDADPSWSPDGRQIVFTSERDGNQEIYVATPGGGSLVNLTRHPAPDRDPEWSPDGEAIAFTSGRGLRTAIYVMGSDGDETTRVTDGTGVDDERPVWSPGGRRLAFQSNRDGASEIVIVDLDTGLQQVVAASASHEVSPAWSPDGSELVYLSNRESTLWDVWIAGSDGASPESFASNSTSREARPIWSPDGRQIAFESRREGNWDVFVANRDGSELRLLIGDDANDGSLAWAPTGGLPAPRNSP
jgi:Tol biopolymer transport system component